MSVLVQPLPTQGLLGDCETQEVNLWMRLLVDEARALPEAWPWRPESTWPLTGHRGPLWSHVCHPWSGGSMRAVTASGCASDMSTLHLAPREGFRSHADKALH